MSVGKIGVDSSEAWPPLPLSAWADTYATLHMWTQIVGKVRLALSPHVNHWWEVPLYVNARGLTTSPIPYRKGVFEVQFDFIDHRLDVTTSCGEAKSIRLEPRTVADFRAQFFSLLQSLEIDVKIWNMPVEIPNPIRSGPYSRIVRPSLRKRVLADSRDRGRNLQGISFPFSRQSQSRPLLLGEF